MVYQPSMPEYAVEFFAIFSRLEYALKAERMWIEAPGRVGVDWDRLAKRKEISGIVAALEGDNFARYLIQHPPKKQAILDGCLAWSPQPPPITSEDQLLVMIRRVRNNLFHGSKGTASTERDESLIRACTEAIKELARRLPQVEQRFYPEG